MKAIPLNTTLARHRHRPAVATRLHAAILGALVLYREWRRRARSRMDLAALDDRMLRDIGISRADVWLEINKPFWRD